MYESIKDIIEKGNYELADILEKINTVWLKSYISKEEMEELETLARTNANIDNSIDMINKLKEIDLRMQNFETRLVKLENAEVEEPTEPTEEYPEFAQPTGQHDAYNTGDKITYNGKKYICKMDGCVWDPDTYPAGWEEVVEESES